MWSVHTKQCLVLFFSFFKVDIWSVSRLAPTCNFSPSFFLVLCSSLHSQCSPHLVLCMLNALLHTGLHVLECFVFCFHFCFVVQLFELLGSFLGVLFHSLWKLETSWRLVLLRACARPQGCLWRDLSGTQEERDKNEWKEKKWGERKKKKEGRKCGFSLVWREQRRQWQEGLLEQKILVSLLVWTKRNYGSWDCKGEITEWALESVNSSAYVYAIEAGSWLSEVVGTQAED